MAAYLDRALAWIFRAEGGFSDDPADPGGATNLGVTQAVYDEFRDSIRAPRQSVREITQEEARTIYTSRYWRLGRCGELPWPVCLVHFDSWVQHRPRAANRILQRSAGSKADGVIGPKTLSRVCLHSPQKLAEDMIWARLRLYVRIARSRPQSLKFLAGWVTRMRWLHSAMYER